MTALPSHRYSKAEIDELSREVTGHPVLDVLLKYTSDFVGILSRSRQFILVNHQLLTLFGHPDPDQALSMRPGEVFGCIHSQDHPEGCGEGSACRYCGAVTIVRQAIVANSSRSGEARLMTVKDGAYMALNIKVTAEPFDLGEHQLIMLFITDITAATHKAMMERIFFHDVLNSATMVTSLLNLLNPPENDPDWDEYFPLLEEGVSDVVEQLAYYRQLLDAENGTMAVNSETFDLFEECRHLARMQRHRLELNGYTMTIECSGEEAVIVSDRLLVRRTMLNMLKNAVEASSNGDTITIRVESNRYNTSVAVNNPAVMDEAVRHQLFQRSFSTKGANRGLGTYSMKLITENYLRGRIRFTSESPDGTTFSITLPRRL